MQSDTTYINTTKSTKRLSRFDVTGFFSKKTAHLQSDITYSTQQSQQNACHDSTLRVFSVKRHSFAIWHYIFNTTKSTKRLSRFDVTDVFRKNRSFANWHYIVNTTKSSKSLSWFDVTGFFSKKNSFAIWHYIFNTTKSTKRLSRFDVTGFFQ